MPDAAATAGTVADVSRRASARGLTVSEIAKRYRVGEERVRGWIRRGELLALNVADSKCGRPRFVVLPESLERFERGRAAATPNKPAPRHKRRAAGMIDFYPDSD